MELFKDIDIQDRIPEEIRAFLWEKHNNKELQEACWELEHAIEEAEYWLGYIETLVEEFNEREVKANG